MRTLMDILDEMDLYEENIDKMDLVEEGILDSYSLVALVGEINAEYKITIPLWEITPDLKLVFGLHATSVRNKLDIIEEVNPKIEILWEDCGDFPYNYARNIESEEKFEETVEFTKKLLNLRGGKGVGLVFKGVMMLNWGNFIYQPAPYIMGENSPKTALHDKGVRANGWREYSSEWIRNGEYAAKMLKVINENKKGEVDICTAGTFDGGIYLPFALCAQMFRKLEGDWGDILKKVSRRECITVD